VIRDDVIHWVKTQNAKPGETVQYSWFVFRVTDDDLNIETLNFQRMASFCPDFTIVEQIHKDQTEVLREEGVEALMCNLLQYATVSKTYEPGASNAFLNRDVAVEPNDSGWYLGVLDDPLDVNSPDNLIRRSLYELSIHDHRLTRFWLLPNGFQVHFDGKSWEVIRPEQGAEGDAIDRTS